jgi:hypothetical protein
MQSKQATLSTLESRDYSKGIETGGFSANLSAISLIQEGIDELWEDYRLGSAAWGIDEGAAWLQSIASRCARN